MRRRERRAAPRCVKGEGRAGTSGYEVRGEVRNGRRGGAQQGARACEWVLVEQLGEVRGCGGFRRCYDDDGRR